MCSEDGHDNFEKRTLLLLKNMELAAGESDRGYVLFLASQIDAYLEDIIRAFLIDHRYATEMFEGPYAPFGTLSGKIKASFVLGLITEDEANRAHAVRKVRNVFAHEMSASFNHPDVRRLCARQPIYDGRQTDRDAFMHMGMNAAFPLLYRSVSIAGIWKRTVLTEERATELRDSK